MFVWVMAAIITLIVLAALFVAAKAGRNSAVAEESDAAGKAHYRALLSEIETDKANGRMSLEEAEAAKAEIAREVLRLDSQANEANARGQVPGWVMLCFLGAIGIASLGIYALTGNPEMPAEPLAGREMPATQMSLSDAVKRVEDQLAANPEDAQGWSVVAPIYMRQGRYADAVSAYRKILELLPATAEVETDLAEAIMVSQNGVAEGEPLVLLRSAANRDPDHIRSRFYLAGEATRSGDFESAVRQWNDLLEKANGDEAWVGTAEQGLAVAEAGLNGDPMPDFADEPETPAPDQSQADMIAGMVEGLASRLESEGGTIEEWTRLVRSYLVLGDSDKAQNAYDMARNAYPDETERSELDRLANEAGLE